MAHLKQQGSHISYMSKYTNLVPICSPQSQQCQTLLRPVVCFKVTVEKM